MAGSVNKVFLMGYLGRDPEIRRYDKQDGSSQTVVTNFTLVTPEFWTDRESGEKKEGSQFHRLVVYGKKAEVAEKYLKQGSRIFVEGKIKTRSYTDDNGVDKKITEVLVSNFEFIDVSSNSKNISNDADKKNETYIDHNDKQDFQATSYRYFDPEVPI